MATQFNIDDLNQQLFAQLKVINTEIKGDELKSELSKAKSMCDIAGTILEGKRIQLEAYELVQKGILYADQLGTIIDSKKQIGNG